MKKKHTTGLWILIIAATLGLLILSSCSRKDTGDNNNSSTTPSVTDTSPETETALDKNNLEILMGKAKAMDPELNFKALRYAWKNSKNYAPLELPENYEQMMIAMKSENYKDALLIAESAAEKNITDIEAHITAEIAAQKTGDKEKAAYHEYMANGLVRSILNSGSGKTLESPFVVISRSEERATMGVVGLQLDGNPPQIIEKGGHTYNKFEVVHVQTGDKLDVYFNIDAFAAQIKELEKKQ